MLIQFVVILVLMSAGTVLAANAISLPASEPYTIYYTTNGATPTAPTSNITATSTAAIETFSLVPNAGKGKSYKKPEKLKIHESKREFEKHVKEKHGKRFNVMDYGARQTENGLEGNIFIAENRDPAFLQLGDTCNEGERARRVAIAQEFFLNNSELIGFTENEELQVRGIERNYCGSLYFDRYINGYKLVGSVIHFGFEPQYNYSIIATLRVITPEMYTAAQQKGLSEEEIADIVYQDLNIPTTDNKSKRLKSLPKLEMRKHLRNEKPYVIWEVRDRYFYEIDAITGEIVFKKPNVKY